MTRKIRQPSRGKASQPYRFGAWGSRVGERLGKGNKKEKVKSWYKVQTRERWTAVSKAAARTSLSGSSAAAAQQAAGGQ